MIDRLSKPEAFTKVARFVNAPASNGFPVANDELVKEQGVFLPNSLILIDET